MTSSKEFVDIIVNANKWSPILSGQLFAWNIKTNKIEILKKNGTRLGFKFRWRFLLFIVASMVVRIVNLNISKTTPNQMETKTVEIKLCIMMIIMCLCVSECYRVWSYFPEPFIAFLNGIIDMDINVKEGRYIFLSL